MNPIQQIKAIFITIIGLILLSFAILYSKKSSDLKEAQAQIAALEVIAENAKKRAKEVKTEVVTEYVDRVKIVKEKGSVIEKQIPVYIPVGTPDLPGGFRLLHDAAATSSPVAEAPERANAAPVPVEDATRTVAQNYEQCHVAYERVRAWERYFDGLCAIYGCED